MRARPRGRPWLLWVHYYDPHDPYMPPERFRRPGPRGSYDGEVAAVDEAIGRLREGLARVPSPNGLLTVLTADHGESLGEHGEDTHGFFVYESTLQVPLLFHFPGRVRPGASSLPARLADVAPTILELADVPALPEIDGVSLLPLLGGKAQTLPPAYAESYQPWLGYGWAPLFACARGTGSSWTRRALSSTTCEGDPAEGDNRAAAAPDEAKRLADLLDARRGASAPEAARAEDPGVAEGLRALGYVGGGAGPGGAIPTGLADPKDRLRLKSRLSEGERLLARRQYRESLAVFDEVLAEEPEEPARPPAVRECAPVPGRPRDAVSRLEPLVALDPYQPEARYLLADALTRSGRTRGRSRSGGTSRACSRDAPWPGPTWVPCCSSRDARKSR